MITEDQVMDALYDVVDPELGIDIVNLGLVYGVHIDPDNAVSVDMTLTTPACPLTDVIEDQVDMVLDGLASRSRVNWVWVPRWSMERITDEGREQLRMIGFSF